MNICYHTFRRFLMPSILYQLAATTLALSVFLWVLRIPGFLISDFSAILVSGLFLLIFGIIFLKIIKQKDRYLARWVILLIAALLGSLILKRMEFVSRIAYVIDKDDFELAIHGLDQGINVKKISCFPVVNSYKTRGDYFFVLRSNGFGESIGFACLGKYSAIEYASREHKLMALGGNWYIWIES